MRVKSHAHDIAHLLDVDRDILGRAERELQAWVLAGFDRHQRQAAPFAMQLQLGGRAEREIPGIAIPHGWENLQAGYNARSRLAASAALSFPAASSSRTCCRRAARSASSWRTSKPM